MTEVRLEATSGTQTVDLTTADSWINDTLCCTCPRCQLHELNLMASIVRNFTVINSYTLSVLLTYFWDRTLFK
jgi:hypothetical protein